MKTATAEVTEFGIDDFDSRDEATMTVVRGGVLTTWVWTFAGPGHSKTIEQNNRMARAALLAQAEKEAAQVNGRKWVAPESSVEESMAKNVTWIVERLIDWSPVKINGELVPFSAEAARKLLSDPRKSDLYSQAVDFLASNKSFMNRSVKE